MIRQTHLELNQNCLNLNAILRANKSSEIGPNDDEDVGFIPEEMILDLSESRSLEEGLTVFKSFIRVVIEQLKSFTPFNDIMQSLYFTLESQISQRPKTSSDPLLISFMINFEPVLIDLLNLVILTKYEGLEEDQSQRNKTQIIMSHFIKHILDKYVVSIEKNLSELRMLEDLTISQSLLNIRQSLQQLTSNVMSGFDNKISQDSKIGEFKTENSDQGRVISQKLDFCSQITDSVSEIKIQKLINCNQTLASKLETIVDKSNSQIRDKDATIDELTEKLIKVNSLLDDRNKMIESSRTSILKQELVVKSLQEQKQQNDEREAMLL